MPLSDYTKTDKNKIVSDNRMLMLVDIEIPCEPRQSSEDITYPLYSDALPIPVTLYKRVSIVGEHNIPVGTMFRFVKDGIESINFYQVTHIYIHTVSHYTRLEFIPEITEHYKTSDSHIKLVTSTTTTVEYYNVRIVRDNKDFSWNGKTWTAMEFDIDEILQTSKGEIPRLDLRVSNTNRLMELYLQQYDFYLKTHLHKLIYANIYVVNSGLENTYEHELNFRFELKQPKTTDKLATFTLGATSPYTHRFPYCRMFKNQGRVKKFGDVECGYAKKDDEICDRQLATCKKYKNDARYCGFPSLGVGAIKL